MSLLDALESFHHRLLEAAEALHFDKKNPVDFNRMALYGSLLEFTGAICALLRHDGQIGVPSVFRSFLEAAVELRNLSQDPGYCKNMIASHHAQWLKVLVEAKKGGNPYLESIEKLPVLDEQIQMHTRELEKLTEDSRPPLNAFDRFARANMTEEYRSIYNFVSCDAHSNVRALISRHIAGDGSDFEIAYYKDEPLSSFDATLDSVAALLLQGAQGMHKDYGPEKSEEIDAMLEELNTLRAGYGA